MFALLCTTVLGNARYTHADAVQPLLGVCSHLPAKFDSSVSLIRIWDSTNSREFGSTPPTNEFVLTHSDRECKGHHRCIPVDGCMSPRVAAALVLLFLNLGANSVMYSQVRIAAEKMSPQCEELGTIESLFARNGSEATLYQWLAGTWSLKTGLPVVHAHCNPNMHYRGRRAWQPSAAMNAFGLDKGSLSHMYTKLYDSLFISRSCWIEAVLEVGLGTLDIMRYNAGRSLHAFRRIFPMANITGLDVDADSVQSAKGARMHTYQCDSRNATQVKQSLHGSLFDIIVDDGLHTISAQLATLRALWPFLHQGGFYVIEDVYELENVARITMAIDHSIAICTGSPIKDWLILTTKVSGKRPIHVNWATSDVSHVL